MGKYEEAVYGRIEKKGLKSDKDILGYLEGFAGKSGNAFEQEGLDIYYDYKDYIALKSDIKNAKPLELSKLQDRVDSLNSKRLKDDSNDLLKDKVQELEKESEQSISIATSKIKMAKSKSEVEEIFNEVVAKGLSTKQLDTLEEQRDYREKQINKEKAQADKEAKELKQEAHQAKLKADQAAAEERRIQREKDEAAAEEEEDKAREVARVEANRIREEGERRRDERRRQERNLEDVVNE